MTCILFHLYVVSQGLVVGQVWRHSIRVSFRVLFILILGWMTVVSRTVVRRKEIRREGKKLDYRVCFNFIRVTVFGFACPVWELVVLHLLPSIKLSVCPLSVCPPPPPPPAPFHPPPRDLVYGNNVKNQNTLDHATHYSSLISFPSYLYTQVKLGTADLKRMPKARS